MLIFTMSWSGNLSMTFAVPERDKKFCDEYFTAMLPKDIWQLLQCGYHNVDTDDEFDRIWELLQNQLSGFVLPKPTEISVRVKSF